MKQCSKTSSLVITAAIGAIIIIMAFTPFGYIPLGFMNATIIHVPVIIGSIFLGPKYGGFLGLVFGLTSVWKNTYMPNLTSFVFSPFVKVGEYGGNFWSLVISIVPRVLVGIVAYVVYKELMKMLKANKSKRIISLSVAGVTASLIHTLLVMNLIYLCFGKEYGAAAKGITEGVYGIIIGIIFMNGIPEAFVAGILTVAVTQALLKAAK